MLRAVALVALSVLPATCFPAAARGSSWRWPVHGRVVGAFSVSPGAPFAAGQRRGIAIVSPAGADVRAACGGRVAFAGAVGRAGPTLSVLCPGGLRATYEGLGRVLVARGEVVLPGARVGVLSRAGVLRLGARVEGDAGWRRRYVDPARLLGPDPRPPPSLGPAPRARELRRRPPLAPRPVLVAQRGRARAPAPSPVAHAPLAAWIGVALLALAAPAEVLRRRRPRPSMAHGRAPGAVPARR